MVEAEKKKSPKKPAKKSSYRKKAPPNPTSPHLPSDDASSHHDETLDRYPSLTPVRSLSASQTFCPLFYVSYIAGDGKGPGEGPVKVNNLKTPLFQLYFVSAIHLYVIFF